jgi:magnesium-transporting ATPase (P-type)
MFSPNPTLTPDVILWPSHNDDWRFLKVKILMRIALSENRSPQNPMINGFIFSSYIIIITTIIIIITTIIIITIIITIIYIYYTYTYYV